MIQLAPSADTLRERLQAPSRTGTKQITTRRFSNAW